jgi:hypothetical protein
LMYFSFDSSHIGVHVCDLLAHHLVILNGFCVPVVYLYVEMTWFPTKTTRYIFCLCIKLQIKKYSVLKISKMADFYRAIFRRIGDDNKNFHFDLIKMHFYFKKSLSSSLLFFASKIFRDKILILKKIWE